MNTLPIYIISGGLGASGKQLLETALAQFPDAKAEIVVLPHVKNENELEAAVTRAATTGGIIIHTLVDADLRGYMVESAHEYNVTAIDLIGPLMLHLSRILQQQPLGQPGLFRKLHEDYFKRIAAIEFTVDHDDGARSDELDLAEIVLVGVSRVGKTPVSMYLSTQGWSVANVPLVKNISPPPQLFEIDHRRVVSLTIEPGQLIAHRRARHQRLGTSSHTSYTDPQTIYEDVEFARSFFRKNRFTIVDVTDRPIEEISEEIITRVTRHLR